MIFLPLLSGKNVIRDFYTDYPVYNSGYVFLKTFSEALKNNTFTLWSPEIYGGYPIWLTQIDFFSPLGIILFKFFDYILAYNWLLFFDFLLAGLAAYYLARNLNLSTASSIVAGLTYELNRLMLFWGNQTLFSDTYVFLPLLFVMILKLKNGQHKYLYLFLTALITACGLLAGETQLMVFYLIGGLAFLLFLNWRDLKNFKISFPVAGFIIAVIAGGIVASIRIIPIINYLPYTARTGRVPIHFHFSAVDLLAFFYPFLDFSALTKFSDFFNHFTGFQLYIAILSLFLAVAAIIFWRKDRFVSFFTCLFVLTYIIRIEFLGLPQLLSFVPILNRFRVVDHWEYLSAFALAMLVGFGLEYFDEIIKNLNFKKYLKALKIFAVFNIIGVALINIAVIFQSKILSFVLKYYDTHIYTPAKAFSLNYYHNIIAETLHRQLYSFSLANPRFLFPFLFIIISTVVILLFYKGKISFPKFKTLTVFIVALNLISVFFNYNVSPREIITTAPDTAKFIQKDFNSTSPFRVMFWDSGEAYYKFEVGTINMDDYRFKTLEENLSLYFGTETIQGNDPFVPTALIKASEANTQSVQQNCSDKAASANLFEGKIQCFTSKSNSEFLGFMNVKYVLTSSVFPKPWKKVFWTTATERKIPIYLYENPDFVERAYLVDKQGDRDKSGEVSIVSYSAQNVKIKVDSTKEDTLVFSEMNLPTWLAYIDGQPVKITTYKDLFMSVKMPVGEHTIEFIYPSLWRQFKLAAMNLLESHTIFDKH